MGHETHTKNHEKTTWLGTSTHEAELNMVRCRVRRDLRAVFAGVALGDRVAHHVEFSCDFVKVSCRAAMAVAFYVDPDNAIMFLGAGA